MAPTSPQPRRSPRRKNHSVSGAAPQPRPAPRRRTRAERKEQRAVSDTASMQEAAVDVDMAAAAAPLEPMDASLKESIAEVVALAQGAFAVSQPVQADTASQASLERFQAIPLRVAARASAQPEAQPQQPLIADAPTSVPQTALPNHQRTEATGLSSPPPPATAVNGHPAWRIILAAPVNIGNTSSLAPHPTTSTPGVHGDAPCANHQEMQAQPLVRLVLGVRVVREIFPDGSVPGSKRPGNISTTVS